jgi:hypothetical protein
MVKGLTAFLQSLGGALAGSPRVTVCVSAGAVLVLCLSVCMSRRERGPADATLSPPSGPHSEAATPAHAARTVGNNERRVESHPREPVRWRHGMAPATESQCAELLVGVSRQQQMFAHHVAMKERAARGSAEPTMALTISRAHLQRALAAEEELLAGRAWLIADVIPPPALGAAERDDEVPVLLDLGTQRAVVFVGRARHPRF